MIYWSKWISNVDSYFLQFLFKSKKNKHRNLRHTKKYISSENSMSLAHWLLNKDSIDRPIVFPFI